jgi:phosphate starvation-inducible PhoH-like protein
LGNGAKAVITGDLTQTDLPNPKKSGLLEALHVLDGVEGIKFCHFEDVDVVRHQLVQRIVRAYDSYKAAEQLPLAIDMPGERSDAVGMGNERPKRAVQTQ